MTPSLKPACSPKVPHRSAFHRSARVVVLFCSSLCQEVLSGSEVYSETVNFKSSVHRASALRAAAPLLRSSST
jgi:hypothetical protein